MLLIDLEQGRIIDDEELKGQFASAKPYRQWIESVRVKLEDAAAEPVRSRRRMTEALLDRQQAFGYTQEDIKFLMNPMASGWRGRHRLDGQRLAAGGAVGQEQAALQLLQAAVRAGHQPADRPDPRGDRDVAGVSFVGPKPNLLDINAVNPPMRLEIRAAHPRRRRHGAAARHRSATPPPSSSATRSTSPTRSPGATRAWRRSSRRSAPRAVDAIKGGHNILIITDRHVEPRAGRDAGRCWRCRPCTSTWCAKACARPRAWLSRPVRCARCISIAVLAGYGAEAIHPYLALETLRSTCYDGHAQASCRPTRRSTTTSRRSARALSKIMSKMGVSTYMSYCGAQLFEAIGLEKATWSQKYFRGTASPRSAASTCSTSPRKPSACTSAAFGDDPVLDGHARCGRRIRLARARRRAHVDARRHRQAAAQHARQPLRHLSRNTRS